MPTISNDHDLRDALSKLTPVQQRTLGASFTKSVIHLCKDQRVVRSVETAQDPNASEEELQEALKVAKGYAARTYTACGRDTDWLAQADHFVATSAAAALTPTGQLPAKSDPAWKAAVQARMANNCALMEEEEGETETEAQRQYRIAAENL
jgi:hypothetical protein